MKTCSYCAHVNEDTATHCVECGTAFSVPEPIDPGLVDPNQSLVIVATFGDVAPASVLKARLEQAGIEACIPEELNPSPFGNFPPLAHVTVRVAQKDYEAAKLLAADAKTGESEEVPG
jgi:hypothetical protein